MQQPLPEFEDHDVDRAELHVSGNAGPGRALELGEVVAVVATLRVTAVEHKTKTDKESGNPEVTRSHKGTVETLYLVPAGLLGSFGKLMEDARVAETGQPRLNGVDEALDGLRDAYDEYGVTVHASRSDGDGEG